MASEGWHRKLTSAPHTYVHKCLHICTYTHTLLWTYTQIYTHTHTPITETNKTTAINSRPFLWDFIALKTSFACFTCWNTESSCYLRNYQSVVSRPLMLCKGLILSWKETSLGATYSRRTVSLASEVVCSQLPEWAWECGSVGKMLT